MPHETEDQSDFNSCRDQIDSEHMTRALVICSESTIQNELSNIRSILINNGHPEVEINTTITRKTNDFQMIFSLRNDFQEMPSLSSLAMAR